MEDNKTVLEVMQEFTEQEKQIVLDAFERAGPHDLFNLKHLLNGGFKPKIGRRRKRESLPEIKELSVDKQKALLYILASWEKPYRTDDGFDVETFRKDIANLLKSLYWPEKIRARSKKQIRKNPRTDI